MEISSIWTYLINQYCTNTINLDWQIENYTCEYHINYDYLLASDFIFYVVILPIVWVYLFFKFIRFILDLFFDL